jgi:hypothetical protein
MVDTHIDSHLRIITLGFDFYPRVEGHFHDFNTSQ